ncbi:MAG: hypothetical protein GY755_11570, partial [Chloroflexi bacterium]|nr:hypothetical protein [Chloroflexota bacterium]
DVVLTAEERTTPDPKCAENFDNPSSEKNVFLDGAEIDISPEEPLEVQDITLVKGAEWNLHDGIISAQSVNAENADLFLSNGCFVLYGWGFGKGTIKLNPSCISAEVFTQRDSQSSLVLELGGTEPAIPENRGLGHFAHIQADRVRLNGELELFSIYGFHPEPGQQFEIISVGNSLKGEFVNAPEGSIIDGFCDVQLRISYMGGDGNDVVLTAEERTTPDPKCAENFDNPSSEKNVFLDGAEIDISP